MVNSAQEIRCVAAGEKLPAGAEELGVFGGKRVGAVDTAVLARRLPGEGDGLTLLYWTRAAYEDAARDLTTEEMAELVARRAMMDGTQISDLAEELWEKCGEMGAAALAESRRGNAASGAEWRAVAGALEAAHRRGYEMGRPLDWGPMEAATANGLRATILALEQELSRDETAPEAMRKAAALGIAGAERTQSELAEAAMLLGIPEYQKAPARDQETRAVLTSGGEPVLARRIERGELPVETWRESWVVGLSGSEAAAVTKLPGTAVLYLSMEEFLRAETRLTPAQLDRELTARVKARRPDAGAYARRVVQLRMRLCAHLGLLLQAMPEDLPDGGRMRARLGAAKERETLTLSAYAAAPEDWAGALRLMAARLEALRYFSGRQGDAQVARWCESQVTILRNAGESIGKMGR